MSSCCGVFPTNQSNAASRFFSRSAGARAAPRSITRISSGFAVFLALRVHCFDHAIGKNHEPVAIGEARRPHLIA